MIPMKKIFGLLWIGISLLTGACEDSEDVTPSMADQDRMDTLFDTSIPELVTFKDLYGTYILYQFDPLLDFAYQFEVAQDWRDAQITYLDKEEVQNAFAFLQEYFISCYRDTIMVDRVQVVTNLKKEYFPRKFLICSKIKSSKNLGLSAPVKGYHRAVANINSFTIADLDRETLNGLSVSEKTAYIQQLHYIYVAGYLVNSRRNIFVPEKFFDPCEKLYGTKVDKTGTWDEDYFMKRGFFPVSKEEGYYPQQIDDLQDFIVHVFQMDASLKAKIDTYSLMRNKVEILVKAMSGLGVDVARINPLLADYLNL